MALTVEDGTGLAAADALVSLAACDAFHTDRGNTTWTGTDAAKEVAIRRASAFLSNAYAWQGWPVQPRVQALAWPRVSVIDRDGYSVASDAVPREIADACCLIALQELVEPGSMDPTVIQADKVKRERVEGAIEVEYANARTDAEASRPVLLAVRDLIGGLTRNNTGGGLAGVAVRG